MQLRFRAFREKCEAMSSAALAIAERKEEILTGLAEGKRIDDLNLGIDRRRVSEAMRSNPTLLAEYRAAIEAGLEKRLDDAEDAIESADERDVARARAYWQATAWRAEREVPSRWSSKTETKLDATLTIALVNYNSADVVPAAPTPIPALESPKK